MLQLFSPNSVFGRWMAFFLDALFISIAWAICCVPIFTIGVATTALYRVAINWMKDRSGCDLKHFFMAFRDNFKKGTVIWLILLVPLAIILFNAYAVWFALIEAPDFARFLIIFSAVLWVAACVYVFALQATFENTPLRTVTNALRISLSYLGTTIPLVLLFAFAVFCTLLFPYCFFIYVSFCVFLSARPVWSVLNNVAGNSVESGKELSENEKKENNQ